MFRTAQNKQKIVFDSLIFGRELVERPEASFKLSVLESLGFDAEVSCVAWDPLQSLLAVATQSGRIAIYAKQGIPKCTWSIRPSQAVKHLVLKAGSPFVIVVGACRCIMEGIQALRHVYADAKATLSVYDISDLDDRGEPARLFAHSLRSHLKWASSYQSMTMSDIAGIPQLYRVCAVLIARFLGLSRWQHRHIRCRASHDITLSDQEPMGRSR
jgi:hypothetical protein